MTQKFPKGYTDAEYYAPGRKKKVCGSTKATSKFLGIICEENPRMTIRQMKELLTDRTRFLPNPEAISVLDAHIEAGYGDRVPNWRY